jgi:hypothetical protein
MKVIEKPAAITPRKAYFLEENEQEYVNFTKGVEVLPADFYNNPQNAPTLYYVSTHDATEPGWSGGGHECIDGTGARRAFYLDSIIVHPRLFKRKEKAEKIRTRTGTGKRGRPKMDPSLKKTPTVYVKTGGKRGRPAKDPSERKSVVYVKTGGKRGRPKKSN